MYPKRLFSGMSGGRKPSSNQLTKMATKMEKALS